MPSRARRFTLCHHVDTDPSVVIRSNHRRYRSGKRIGPSARINTEMIHYRLIRSDHIAEIASSGIGMKARQSLEHRFTISTSEQHCEIRHLIAAALHHDTPLPSDKPIDISQKSGAVKTSDIKHSATAARPRQLDESIAAKTTDSLQCLLPATSLYQAASHLKPRAGSTG